MRRENTGHFDFRYWRTLTTRRGSILLRHPILKLLLSHDFDDWLKRGALPAQPQKGALSALSPTANQAIGASASARDIFTDNNE